MKSTALIQCALALALVIPSWSQAADPYPEFTGQYLKCGEGWCDFASYEMETMDLWERAVDHSGRAKGKRPVTYTGWFRLPKDIPVLAAGKPRFLFFEGRSRFDPATVALVELQQLPFNGAEIARANGKEYKDVRYSADNIDRLMWTFKREVLLRFRPIEGRTGMYLFEPIEPLDEGLYAIDSGDVGTTGYHTGLTTQPMFMGFVREGVQISKPFAVGKTVFAADMPQPGRAAEAGAARQAGTVQHNNERPISDGSGSAQAGGELGNAIDGLLKGIFGGGR